MFVIIFESLTKILHARFYPRSPDKGVTMILHHQPALQPATLMGPDQLG
jgi:hypothetical protein